MSEIANAVVAEWLEGTDLPDLIEREVPHPPFDQISQVLAVVGPRRAGKTFYFFQLIEKLMQAGRPKSDILFVDFEDYRLAEIHEDPMGRLLEAFHRLTGHLPKYVFLDEVQQLPGWSRVVRTLHNRRNLRVAISGSNSHLLGREVATELRGRCLECRILPFSFPEFLRLRKMNFTRTQAHTAARGSLLAAFGDYLHHGGFPDVTTAGSPRHRRSLLQGYFETIYYKDILERHDIRAKETLAAMMRHAVDQAGELFSISAFGKTLKARGLDASKRTLANYLGYLEDAFFVIAAEKFAFSQRQRTANPVKCFLWDTGFKQLAAPSADDRGKLLENVVAIELRRRGREFFYYRDRVECDFVVVEAGRPVSSIQVCWDLNDKNRGREIAGLRAAREHLGTKDDYILTHDQSGEEAGIPLIPVWQWLLGWVNP
jgi:predicted AAA+ superfamily ATPase